MVLVHRFIRLDVSPDCGIAARHPLEKGHLDFVPCLPPDWTSVEILYRYKATSYKIIIEQQPAGTGTEVLLDNVVQPEARIPLEDDMKEHHVLVRTVPKK